MDRRVFLFPLILCSLMVPVGGQQPQQPPSQSSAPKQQNPPREDDQDIVRITTNLVQVDVVVSKDGKQITDLKPEDFELFEDGRPQTITNFSYISNVPAISSSTAAVPSTKDKNGPPVVPAVVASHDVRRTIALVVDDLGMSFESISQTRRQVRKFIDEKLLPNDLVAIIRTGGEVGALQQFTTDRRALYNAIEHLRWHPCSRTGLYVFAPTGSITPQSESPCGGSRSISDTLHSLKFIVKGMSELPGRKSLVVFSDQLPIETQEPGTINSQVQRENNPSLAGTFDPGIDDNRTSYLGQLQKVAEQAIRASVVIYAVDTRGLAYTGITAADRITGNYRGITNQINSTLASRSLAMIANREGADLIAKQTGGFLVRNSNDFQLNRIADDQKGFYLLGYRPSDTTFNRQFHHIKVKVKGRGLAARTREGFYGISEEDARPRELTATDQFKKALMSPFGKNDINLRLTTIFTNFDPGGSLLRSLVYVNAQDLTFVDEPDGGHKATFDLGVVLFGDNGRVRDQQSRLVTLVLHGKDYESARQSGIVYTLDTPLKLSGGFQFRIALRDQNSSRIGSAGQFIQIPNLENGRLALSGLVLLKDVQDKPEQPSSDGPPPGIREPDDAIKAGPALRQFREGSKVLFAYSIYNPRLDQNKHVPRLTAQTRIFRDGKPVFNGDPSPIDADGQIDLKRVPNVTRVQLGSEFSPGYYVLQVVVTDRLADAKQQTASQWIDFEVVK